MPLVSRLVFFMIAIVPLVYSCGPSSDKKIVTEEVIEELENRKIKKVSPSELNSIAYDLGRKLRQEFADSINNTKNCIAIARSLSASERIIHIMNLDTANNEITLTEKVLIESYLYSFANNLPFGDNISENGSDTLIYTDIIKNKSQSFCPTMDSLFLFVAYYPTKSIVRSLED